MNTTTLPTHSVIDIKEPVTDRFYGIHQTQLSGIVQNKDLKTLRGFDGVKGLAKTLHTHLENGIEGQDLSERTTVFGSNTYEKPPPKGLFYFVADAFKHVTILIVMGCAVLSLGFGIKEDGIKDGWYEGGSILLAMFLVIGVSAVSNFRHEKQFDSLSKISNNIKTDVVREGRRQKISIFDIVVGDVVVLNVGDQIPADGLFIDGHSLLVDESRMTGESEQIDVNLMSNPFLISGAKVTDGHCRMLVLSVGMNTAWGKMMSSNTSDNNEQTKCLRKLTSSIVKLGLALAFLVFLVILVLDSVISINFSAAITILVVAIPDGLQLTVTLTLAYSMKRMMGDQAMVMKLSTVPEVTEDDVFTTKVESGMQEEFEEEVEVDVQFRNLTDDERMQKVDKIRVMARSSPFDKLLMVQCLKQKGHVVAVTKAGTNDAPALKEVDIGLAMGIQGTEVVNESSDSVILDDNFACVSTVLISGRCSYNNIQKLIHFQLTVNVAALVINFITMVTSGGVPLTAVQLLWVNLIMDTLGSLALATEGPAIKLLTKAPVGRVKPLVTNIMWRNLFAQVVFQITILLTFHFKGEAIFNVEERVKKTIIFNTFVLCQVFNEFNSRKLKKRNIFKGIHKSKLFVGSIIVITVFLEIVMVNVLKNLWDTRRSNGVQWGIYIAITTLSWLSQKEEAWNSENEFLTTTVESLMKKRMVSESFKHDDREELNIRILHIGFQEGLKAGYHFSWMGVALEDATTCFDLKQGGSEC